MVNLHQPPAPKLSPPKVVLQFILQLIQQYPLVCWGGIWAAMMTVAGFAVFGLLDPTSSQPVVFQPETPSPAAQESLNPQSSDPEKDTFIQPAPTKSAVQGEITAPQNEKAQLSLLQEEALPGWILVAIALSCASGCLVLWRLLNHPGLKKQSPRSQTLRGQTLRNQTLKSQTLRGQTLRSQTLRKKNAPSLPQRRAPKKLRSPQRSHALVRANHPLPVKAEQPVAPLARSLQPQFPKPAADPVVTVLPENARHPLDFGEDSLVEIMDLRKRQSLSSILSSSS